MPGYPPGMAIRLRFRPLLAAALLCLGATSTALAWAPLGHALVGELAQRHLDPKARAEIARLLAGEPTRPALLDVYGWADVAALEKAFAAFAR